MLGSSLHEALSVCDRIHQANLLTIRSKEESNFIQNQLFEKFYLEYSVWLGLIRLNSTDFVWLPDRNTLNYSEWAPEQPDNFNSKHYCVVISTDTKFFRGKWYDQIYLQDFDQNSIKDHRSMWSDIQTLPIHPKSILNIESIDVDIHGVFNIKIGRRYLKQKKVL
ncbi:hypothetical protein NH340_JMT08615 [Sarcoptes scabiei]|nr:hypothetical protein NH340_JMT08615 [Sarcoptes scabiei]